MTRRPPDLSLPQSEQLLRPLIGDDNAEIMELAEQIGIFEISPLPHDISSTQFL